MCNEAARRVALGQLREDWSDLRIPLTFPEGLPNLAPEESIRITDPAFILRAHPDGDSAEGVVRRWSWPGPSGKPVYNYRSEGRALPNAAASSRSPQSSTLRGGSGFPQNTTGRGTSGRCLIVVDSFFEYTDPPPDAPKRSRKTRWRFTAAARLPESPQAIAAQSDWFCIAGVWRTEPKLGEGRAAEAWAMLTCDPGPDVAPYHHRQVVVPLREQWGGWLDGSLPASEVCRPAAAGTFLVERA